MDLIASRQMGMSAGPIWWTTIQEYGEKHNCDVDQIEAMHSHVKDMDLAYLKQMGKKQ
jgi:hypothetical protein